MTIKHEQYGLASYVCAQARIFRDALSLNQWIMPPILHEQIMFVFDRGGIPLGYWTWAYLASDVESRLLCDHNARLHDSEWNEGDSLWIMDFVFYAGYVSDVVAFIIRNAHFGHDSINVRRQGKLKKMEKQSKWRSKFVDDYDDRVRNSPVFRLPRSSFAKSHSAWLENDQRLSTTF